MKVIFLDFDGVIITARTVAALKAENGGQGGWSRSKPDPLLCSVLRACCRTGVKIVISSTWRDMGEARDRVLRDGGLLEFLHEDPYTTLKTSNGLASDRPFQISEWLGRHPEVTNYRILDDEAWHWTGDQAVRWVRCDSMDGMCGDLMLKLLQWGTGKAEEDAS